MSIEPKQLRQLIRQTLLSMGEEFTSDSAVELLMLTSAQESHCGRYITQLNGPAQGIFQMEPATELDIYKNYLRYNEPLHSIVKDFRGQAYPAELNLIGNIPYQIAIARANYKRFPERLPPALDIEGLARYWKKYWNTPLGAGTIQEAVANYGRYAREV